MVNTKHNNVVRKEIRKLKRQGYTNIKADLPNYDQPDPMGKYKRVPDIVATKKGIRKIIEIEPKGRVSAHKDNMPLLENMLHKRSEQFLK